MAEAARHPARGMLRGLALPVLLPTALTYTAQGAALPALVLTARGLGASAGVAAVAIAVLSAGQVLGAVPAGALVARSSEPAVLAGSSVLSALCWAGCGLAPDLASFLVAVWASGVAGAAFGVARQTYVAESVPHAARARAMSTLGGAGRAGLFLGPLLGAGAQQLLGIAGAYAVAAVASLAAMATVILTARSTGARHPGLPRRPRLGLLAVARENRRALLTVGTGVAVIAAARGLRPVLLPLWSTHVGLSATQLSTMFSVAAGMELLLFYPAGSVMDRFGRAWTAAPAAALLGLSLLLLPLTHSVGKVAAVAVVMGMGSGIGSGIVKVLGVDCAPPEARPEFLGIWTTLAECGSAGGPLLAGAIVAALTLPVACVGLGIPTVLTAGWLAWHVPKVAR